MESPVDVASKKESGIFVGMRLIVNSCPVLRSMKVDAECWTKIKVNSMIRRTVLNQ
jgi:hypothetical protein